MDMKKYFIYCVLIALLISGAISIGVWSKRNDFQLGFNKVYEGVEDTIGDVTTIKNLKYQFYIGDAYNDGGHLWEVNGVGEKFTVKDIKNDSLLYKKWLESNFKIEDTGIIVKLKESFARKDNNEYRQLFQFSDQGMYIIDSDTMNFDISYYDGFNDNKFHIGSSKDFQIISEIKEQDGYKFEFDTGKDYPFREMTINTYGTQKIEKDEYFFISARNFNFDVSKYKFSSNPAGIYKVDSKTKEFKKILDLDMKKENIITMKAQKEHLVCLTQKGNDVYLKIYDKQGNVESEQVVNQNFNNLLKISLVIDNDYIITNLLEKFSGSIQQSVVYKSNKNKIHKIESFHEKVTDWDSGSNTDHYLLGGLDDNVYYRYQENKLFVVKQGYSRFSISVYDKKKCLYNSYLTADFQKDSILALDSLSTYSMKTPLAIYLNGSERRILGFNWK